MSGSNVITNFSQEVSMAFSKALEAKGKELDEREIALNEKETHLKEREDFLENLFSNRFKKNQHVSVQVGYCCYETTFDILLSHSNSYFHQFQWTEDKKISEAPTKIFIHRDPLVFRFVLEYLTYGKLFSQISDQGILEMLKCDAQFYGLKELANNVQELIEVELEKNMKEKAKLMFAQHPLYLKTSCNTTVANLGFFNWNSLKHDLNTHFRYDGINTYILLKKCLVQVSMKYIAVGSASGNVTLLVNDVATTRCYHILNGYMDSKQICEMLEFEINDRIKFQYSGGTSGAEVLATTLTFLVLHTY